LIPSRVVVSFSSPHPDQAWGWPFGNRGSFSWGMELTAQLHLKLRLEMHGVVSPFAYSSSWSRASLSTKAIAPLSYQCYVSVVTSSASGCLVILEKLFESYHHIAQNIFNRFKMRSI
jgi:hypothetical protein